MFPWWLQGLKTRFYVVGADPSREVANILEFETFSEIFIFLEWWLGYHFPVDAISCQCHTTYVKNGNSSCLYDIHVEIGTTKHTLPIIFYYIKI